jgi:hypothetical protein
MGYFLIFAPSWLTMSGWIWCLPVIGTSLDSLQLQYHEIILMWSANRHKSMTGRSLISVRYMDHDQKQLLSGFFSPRSLVMWIMLTYIGCIHLHIFTSTSTAQSNSSARIFKGRYNNLDGHLHQSTFSDNNTIPSIWNWGLHYYWELMPPILLWNKLLVSSKSSLKAISETRYTMCCITKSHNADSLSPKSVIIRGYSHCCAGSFLLSPCQQSGQRLSAN